MKNQIANVYFKEIIFHLIIGFAFTHQADIEIKNNKLECQP